MLTAEQARKITDSKKDSLEKVLQTVFESIRQACNKGESGLTIDFSTITPFSSAVERILREHGYTIDVYSEGEEYNVKLYCFIHW